MAGVKISELPSISAPLLADIFPEVQPAIGGTTYKATFQQLLNLYLNTANTWTAKQSFTTVNISSLTASQAVVTDASKNLISLQYASTNIASTIVSRDSNGNSYFNNVGTSVATFSSGAIPLTVGTPRHVILNSTASGVTLPDAITLTTGSEFQINNNTSTSIAVNKNGGSLLTNIAAGGYANIYVTDTSTSAGTWDYHFLIPSNVQWGTATLNASSTASIFSTVSSLGFLLEGASTGLISILGQAAAGTYNFNLPTTAGSSGQFLTSAGGGASPMTWATVSSIAVTTAQGTAPIQVNGASGTPVSGTITISATAATTAALGVASFNSTNFTATAGAITSNAITVTSGNNITATASWNLGSTVSVAVTGTTNHAVQIGNASGSLTSTAIGATGQFFGGNTGADPTWQTLSSAAVTSIQGTSNQINPTSPTTGAVTLSLSSTLVTPGTLAINGLTTGSVLFSGASSVVSQDNSNFFWDATNHRLGLSNTSPLSLLHVGNSSTASSNYLRIEATNAVDKGVVWQSSGAIRAYMILPGGSPNFLQITTGVQNIGIDLTNNRTMIGTGTPLNQLDVNGALAVGTYAGTATAPANSVMSSGGFISGSGTAGAPGFTFFTDNTAGMYYTSNVLNFSTESTQRVTIDSNGLTIQSTGLLNTKTGTSAGGTTHISLKTTGTVNRIGLGLITAESGTNSGSNFNIITYDDSGAFISNAITLKRSNGFFGINDSAPVSQLSVVGNATFGYASGQVVGANSVGIAGSLFVGATYPASLNVGALSTQPNSSNTITSVFGSTMTFNSATQNTTGGDILLQMEVLVASAITATLTIGTNATSTVTLNTAITTFSGAQRFTLYAYVPINYYVKVSSTGTISVTSITTVAFPI